MCNVIALAVVLALMPVVAAAETGDPRARAAEETRQAFDAYRDALAKELEQLKSWSQTVPGGRSLAEEREIAKRRLEQLGNEAQRLWDDVKRRMDDVVDDPKRRHGAARGGDTLEALNTAGQPRPGQDEA